jgi:hypothetical protein
LLFRRQIKNSECSRYRQASCGCGRAAAHLVNQQENVIKLKFREKNCRTFAYIEFVQIRIAHERRFLNQ